MLKSCASCGKVHDSKLICTKKIDDSKRLTQANKFRWGRQWKKKAVEIKERDIYMCQVCIRDMYNTTTLYNTHGLSVHHIEPLHKQYGKRLDNDNLVTLCSLHHGMAERQKIPCIILRDIAMEQEKIKGE